MKIKITLLKVCIFMSLLAGLIYIPAYTSADNICSSDNQVMFRLSSATNAHIEKFLPIRNYLTEVCYDSTFGVSYNDSSPRTCTGSNTLLNINSDTNAHAEDPTLSNYNVPICYGDLNCRLTNSSCNANERAVASLSAETNAHVSATSGYNYNLCCSSQYALDQNNTNGNQTTNSLAINVNSPANLTYTTSLIPINVLFNNSGTCSYSLNSQQNISLSTNNNLAYTGQLNLSQNGTYRFQAFCQNTTGAGNASEIVDFSLQLSTTPDVTPPTINLISPLNISYTVLPIPVIATTNEQSTCSFSLNGASNISLSSSNNSTFTSSINNLSDGQHNIKVSCKDSLNNENSTEIRYFAVQTSTPDVTPPTITNITTTPNLPLTTNDSEIEFNVTFNSDEFPITVYFDVVNSLNSTVFTSQTFNINSPADLPVTFSTPSTLADGVYQLFLNAQDNLNNSVRIFLGEFTIDSSSNPPVQSNNTAPIITVHSPTSGTYNVNSLLLNISATNASSIWYSINSGNNITFVSPIFVTFSEGTNTLSVFANNSFNNKSNINIQITIDTSGDDDGNDDGNNGGGGGGSSNNRNRIILTDPNEEVEPNRLTLTEYNSGSEKITFGKKSRFNYQLSPFYLLLSILLLLILLLLILILLAKRRNDESN